VVENLDDILAAFVDLEADRVTLEWTSGGIEVTIYRGPAGIGGVLANPVAGSVVKELVTRAKLEQRTSGPLEATIRGRQMTFVAREYDHFGETAFEIQVTTADATGPTLNELAVNKSNRELKGTRPGRNDPCPCGSGRKFKKCCLRSDEESAELSPRFRFEPGSYGGPGAFMPSIACLKQVRLDDWEYHFVIVRPKDLHAQEETAVAEATRDLDRAFASRNPRLGDVAIAEDLKRAGYVSVGGFKLVET
jgi:hypothetical protein